MMYQDSAVEMPLAKPGTLTPRPPHVPSHLVRPYPYVLGAKTKLRPHSFLAAIHEGPEVFWAERVLNGVTGAWVPRKLDHLRQIYSDNVAFSARGIAPFAALIGQDWILLPMEADSPVHGLLRSMINPALSPKRMSALEDTIRKYAREYIDKFKDKGKCEFIKEFAFEFPIKVFLELMGLPQNRVGQFREWEHKLLHEPDPEETRKATREVSDYLRGEIDDRRLNPRDDLISFGVQCDKDGRRLSADELLGLCFNLFLGGLDTVSTNIAWQFLHLAEHRDHQKALRENPAMIPGAIDELMRFYASIVTYRECLRETRIAGVTIMPGDKVVMSTYLAGHDPEAYSDAERIILNRAPRHVNFGYGPHLCIGMHLARREMRIALEEFLAAIPEFYVEHDADITYYLASVVQPVTLPLAWTV